MSGKVFEGGVSLSVVYGSMPQEALASATERGVDRAAGMKPGERVPFFACGLSSVMHPRNPMAPTMHFNYRYFETDGGVWWFGGGTDITPAYLFEEDMKHFHGTYKEICDKHDPCVNAVTEAYLPVVAKRKDSPFTEKEKEWQLMRRGRYVEFNLVYDRARARGGHEPVAAGRRVDAELATRTTRLEPLDDTVTAVAELRCFALRAPTRTTPVDRDVFVAVDSGSPCRMTL
ncbi:coproporphyrinogen oxidase [Aureococcus anophagefferens]|nr:coproporphyrinogen oxidase [Aureococcus anophagefferens]